MRAPNHFMTLGESSEPQALCSEQTATVLGKAQKIMRTKYNKLQGDSFDTTLYSHQQIKGIVLL